MWIINRDLEDQIYSMIKAQKSQKNANLPKLLESRTKDKKVFAWGLLKVNRYEALAYHARVVNPPSPGCFQEAPYSRTQNSLDSKNDMKEQLARANSWYVWWLSWLRGLKSLQSNVTKGSVVW